MQIYNNATGSMNWGHNTRLPMKNSPSLTQCCSFFSSFYGFMGFCIFRVLAAKGYIGSKERFQYSFFGLIRGLQLIGFNISFLFN